MINQALYFLFFQTCPLTIFTAVHTILHHATELLDTAGSTF